jgi:regulatory protein
MPRRRLGTDDEAGAVRPEVSPRTLALRYLARRDYTSRELQKKLVDRGVDPDEAASLVESLKTSAFIDDRRAAAAHVRTASRVKGRGPRRIQLELEARGVDKQTITEALREIPAEEVDEALARIVSRKLGARSPTPEERDRLFRHLMRRGFAASAIQKALATIRGS